MGDCYVVLQTYPGKGGAYLFDIHFWIGKDSSQVCLMAFSIFLSRPFLLSILLVVLRIRF
uniref:Villin-2 n=1 Tax=Rhizophora mucronata TaxID=61149 RepID=A0A2P2MLR4_RHIMU